MVAGNQTAGLQRGADGSGIVVDLAPAHLTGPASAVIDDPTNVTPVPESAAVSSRSMVDSVWVSLISTTLVAPPEPIRIRRT